MRRSIYALILLLLLTGCGGKVTFEQVDDDPAQQVMQQKKELVLEVKDALALESGEAVQYLCDGYTVTVEILASGNLQGTLRAVTGLHRDALTVVETAATGIDRYELVWTAAGEDGDVVSRVMILDDGAWHYCVTVSASAEEAGQLEKTWQDLFASVRLL